jgi:RNA recognition motif-containing protein
MTFQIATSIFILSTITFFIKDIFKLKGTTVNKRLHIGNLEYSITNEDLETLFSSEGIVTNVIVIRTLEGKSKGFGFVEMETEEEATRAIEKYNKTVFKDRTIFVNEARPQINRDSGRDRGRYRYNKKSEGDLNSKLKSIRIKKKYK